MLKNPSVFWELRLWWQNWGEEIVPAFAGRGLTHLHDAWHLWRWMQELLVRGKNTIYPEVIDPGGQSVEIAPWKVTLPHLTLQIWGKLLFSHIYVDLHLYWLWVNWLWLSVIDQLLVFLLLCVQELAVSDLNWNACYPDCDILQSLPASVPVMYVLGCHNMLQRLVLNIQGVPGGMCQTSGGCSLC
jgi:hypothetical protein